MDPPNRMRIIYYVKHCPAIRLKFGYKTFLTRLMLQTIASIFSPVKENLLLHCRKFLGFAIVCFNLTDFNNKVGSRSYYKEIPFKIENLKFSIEYLKIDFQKAPYTFVFQTIEEFLKRFILNVLKNILKNISEWLPRLFANDKLRFIRSNYKVKCGYTRLGNLR